MADFVAVLKKTIEGLGETTPDVREKVYQKARMTVGAKLAALNPPASPAVVDRQRKALEEAIRTVEAEYAALEAEDEPEPEVEDPLDELDALFSSLSKPPVKAAPAAPREDPAPRPVTPAAPAAAPAGKVAAQAGAASAAVAPPAAAAARDGFRQAQPQPGPAARAYAEPEPRPRDDEDLPFDPADEEPAFGQADAYAPYEEDAPPAARDDDPLTDDLADDDRHYGQARAPNEHSRGRSGLVKMAAGAAAALIVFGGLGYGLWANQDAIGSLFGGDDVAAVTPAPQPAATPAPAEPEPAEEQEEEIAAVSPAPPATDEAADDAPADETTPKFTQRLTPDGSEVDDGPAGGVPLIGEGTSVAAATQAAPPPSAAAPAPDTAVPVGQRAIFYEERTSVAQGSAEPGATVWSLIQESPGNDLPPEPAIRAEATVPGRDIQLRMTIRRNADKSLPASHIVELIFITPENFAGGAIDNVLRMTMKETEESAGSALAGMTAKIADGFFLLALNDEKQARDANNALLRRQNWIDVPIVYKSGRRALMTMEKGIPGEQVFEQALRAWQDADSG
ncbi:hypothetical protein [Aquibium microcysteis]|uniref:hypothetical protein n=1 Tax=Aquibium microcysteis TaxID=675281 RepID=UPI00165D034A|nr:hypothetical protein [Aquibium microcysteis]